MVKSLMTTTQIRSECVDNPYSDFKDNEVKAMNEDFRREQEFRKQEYEN